MATQNEDLAILKLLINNAGLEKKKDNIELAPLNQSNLKELIFGNDNMFLPQAIAKNTPLGEYLKNIYQELFN